MFKMRLLLLMLLSSVSFPCGQSWAQSKRPATPMDCLEVRRLKFSDSGRLPVQFDPTGHYAAYGVGQANLAENRDIVDLYVKSLDPAGPSQPRLLFRADSISELHWLGDGKHLLALVDRNGRSVIEAIDIKSGTHTVLFDYPDDVKEFSIDRSGRTLVFDTEDKDIRASLNPTPKEVADGYRIPVEASGNPIIPTRRLFLIRRSQEGSWGRPRRLAFQGPLNGTHLDKFLGVGTHGDLDLSLSPEGRRLVLTYQSYEPVPQGWSEDPWVKRFVHSGFPYSLTVIVDVERRTSTVAIQSPTSWGMPLWSKDGRYLAIVSSAPIGSALAKEDVDRHANTGQSIHTFIVDTQTLEPTVVAIPAVQNPTLDAPLGWDQTNTLWLHVGVEELMGVTSRGGKWVSGDVIRVPVQGDHAVPVVSTNGRTVIGSYEAPTVPPELYQYDVRTRSLSTLAKLNPEFDEIQLARAERMSWQVTEHYTVDGVLIKPPDFKPGTRYPLVIQTQVGNKSFVCASGPNRFPSEIPLPLADAGVMYLYRVLPFGQGSADSQPYFPKEYPGGIGEAALQAEVWDAAVDQLTREGLVDPDRVGIFGFSRTGWYTEFALAHGHTHYRAADVVDNVQYSLGEYWLSRRPPAMQAYNEMYGGPPYGDGLTSWLKYSISFNLSEIHTPLMMEQMGYGVPFPSEKSIPLNLATAFEVSSGLNALHRAVELYYYPNELHVMDHPMARLENYQRNVDWFRFWLQGYERPKPEDPDQYIRWKKFEVSLSTQTGK